MPERERIGEIAQGDLNPDPLRAQPSWISDEAAHGKLCRRQPPQQGKADRSGGAG
jgi:hypothetical protein